MAHSPLRRVKPRSPIGLIGAGAMGLAIARNLLSRGFPVIVRDIRPERTRAAARYGAAIAQSPNELARRCATVLSVVVDAKQTEAVVFGRDGIVRAMNRGGVLLLCSTLAPAYVVDVARRLRAHDIHVLDTPMSGGPARALDGTMSMMIAGPRSARMRTRAVLAAMSNQRFDWGVRAGDGAAAKITNNLLAGANLAAAAEGLALGMKLGLDARRLLDLFAASSGQSWIGEDRLRRAIRNDYAVRAAPTLLHKDLGLALDSARALGASTPIARLTRRMYREAIDAGYAAEDDAVVLKIAARRAGVAAPGTRRAQPATAKPSRRPRRS